MAKEQDLIIKIQAQTDKATKEIKNISSEIKKLSTETKKVETSTSKSIDKVGKSYSGLGKTLTGLVAGFSALAVGVQAVEFAKLASDAEQSADAFTKVFEDMGLDAEEEFQKIKDASYGLIPEQAIKQSATTAVSLGVPITKLADLMEVARAKAREMGTDAQSAFNDLATGIGRGSPMILDNLGLTIKLGDANQKMASELGKTVEQLTKQEKALALTNAVIDAGADSIERYADAGLSSKEEFQKLQATLADLKVELGKGLLKVLVEVAQETNEWMDSLDPDSVEKFSAGIAKVGSGLIGILKTVGLLNDLALPDWLFGEDATFFGKIAEGWGIIGEAVGVASAEFDALFNATNIADEQALKIDSLARAVENFAGGKEELSGLKKQLEDTYSANEKLIESWSSSGTHLYNEELKRLYEQQHQIEEQLHQISLQENIFKAQEEGAKKAGYATEELTEQITEYSEENKRSIGEFYKDRLATSGKALSELEREEKSLTKAIAKAHQDLAKELSDIAQDRFDSNLDFADKIREAEQEALNTYDLFKDKQLQADEKLALAKQALLNNQLDQYKTYIGQYEALAIASAGQVLKGDNLVKLSAEETASAKVAIYNQLQGLENQYFNQRTQNAQQAHDLTVAQAEAERAGVQATMEAYRVMIDILKQLVEATTGKTVDIDTTALDDLIHKAEAGNTLVESLSRRRSEISVDSSQVTGASAKVEELKTATINGITLKITADTTPLDFGIKQFINEFDTEGNLIGMKVNPLFDEAKQIISNELAGIEATPIKKKLEIETTELDQVEKDLDQVEKQDVEVEVEANTDDFDDIDQELQDAIRDVDAEVEITPNTDVLDDKIQEIQLPTESEHGISVDNSRPERAIASNEVNTSSLHTIYIKEVRTRAEGGVLPQRLAVGGTFSGSGRVAGYDATDSDKVNAYLTGGEFVIKRKAVDLYGVNFLNALNSMKLAKPKGYSNGGIVSNQGTGNLSSNLRPIQLNIGGSSFEMFSPNSVAVALQNFIEIEGGI